MGLLLAVLVTGTNVDDARAVLELFARLQTQPMSKVKRMFADSKYYNYALYEWVEEHADYVVVVIRRREGETGWVQLPIRWGVERTFVWLGTCRRLTVDREKTTCSCEAFIKISMIQMMLNRLQTKAGEAEFHYRMAA